MKKCLLVYYTGTFNTRYLTSLVKARFVDLGYTVDTHEIDPLKKDILDMNDYDLIGLGYPIYGFNAPWPFLKFIRRQEFPPKAKYFIYKNSGETYSANDASSVNVVRKLKHCGAKVDNEYHFMMPYNIHFRFEDRMIKEMLEMDDKLLDILVKEVTEDIPNIKPYSFINRFITAVVKLQFIGGDINSFFYRVDRKKCSGCDLCVKLCPMKNISRKKNGKLKFGHHCLMCMRCSFFCPQNAIHIGYLEGWRVNGKYDFEKIRKLPQAESLITPETEGFFKCYIKSFADIEKRHQELFSL